MSRQVGAKRRAYDPSMVDHAAEVVRSGSMSLCQASKTYQIPKTTLHDRVKNKYESTKIGVKTVLTPEEEKRLEKWALHMSRIGYGRTRKELANVVKEIIDEDGRTTPFVDNRPGRKWMEGFFARHPALKLRTTVQLGKERAIINKDKILKWFSDLSAYVNDEVCDPNLLEDPSRIYNADESGISLCQTKNCKVIGETGAPVVYQYGNSDESQMTIMAAASAVGHYIQPMIIFLGQRFSYNPLQGFEEAALGRSDNGWMDSEVFTSWLTEVFIPGVEARQIKKPVLLLIDGHKTHITLKASDICVEHGIELYCLLEHSSHLTQPLDLRLFGTLKQSWRKAVRVYQSENIGEFVTKQTFARVFKKAWLESTTIEAAVKGFQDSGIFPWNPQTVLGSVKLAPSTIFTENPTASSSNVDTAPPAIKTPNSIAAPAAVAAVATPAMATSESLVTPNATETISTASVIVASVAPPTTTVSESPALITENACSTPAVVAIVNTPAITTPVVAAESDNVMTMSNSPEPSIKPSVFVATAEPSLKCVATSSMSTADPLPNASGDAKSPFSKYLVYPKTESKKSKVRRVILPKAITGKKYRELLKEKEAQKEEELKEKQKRKEERLKKKIKRAEELKQRQIALERKRKAREEANKRKKELKEKKRQETERIFREIEASDSDDNVHVSVTDCFKCETPYEEFVECTNCNRRFHLSCVSDELRYGPDELPFECKYC